MDARRFKVTTPAHGTPALAAAMAAVADDTLRELIASWLRPGDAMFTAMGLVFGCFLPVPRAGWWEDGGAAAPGGGTETMGLDGGRCGGSTRRGRAEGAAGLSWEATALLSPLATLAVDNSDTPRRLHTVALEDDTGDDARLEVLEPWLLLAPQLPLDERALPALPLRDVTLHNASDVDPGPEACPEPATTGAEPS